MYISLARFFLRVGVNFTLDCDFSAKSIPSFSKVSVNLSILDCILASSFCISCLEALVAASIISATCVDSVTSLMLVPEFKNPKFLIVKSVIRPCPFNNLSISDIRALATLLSLSLTSSCLSIRSSTFSWVGYAINTLSEAPETFPGFI